MHFSTYTPGTASGATRHDHEHQALVDSLAKRVVQQLGNPVGFASANMANLRAHVDDLLTLLEACRQELAQAKAEPDTEALAQALDYPALKHDIHLLLDESSQSLDKAKEHLRLLREHLG